MLSTEPVKFCPQFSFDDQKNHKKINLANYTNLMLTWIYEQEIMDVWIFLYSIGAVYKNEISDSTLLIALRLCSSF